MCVKGEKVKDYGNKYDFKAGCTLPLKFKTRFSTSTAITDISDYSGDYCNISVFNSENTDQIFYGAIDPGTNFDPSKYNSRVSAASVYIITLGI